MPGIRTIHVVESSNLKSPFLFQEVSVAEERIKEAIIKMNSNC